VTCRKIIKAIKYLILIDYFYSYIGNHKGCAQSTAIQKSFSLAWQAVGLFGYNAMKKSNISHIILVSSFNRGYKSITIYLVTVLKHPENVMIVKKNYRMLTAVPDK